MERRLRSYWTRLGIAKLTDALPLLRGDAAQLDDLLDRVTINVSQLWRHPDQWARLEGGLLQELAGAGTRARVERRVLLRRRGLHAGGRLRRRDPARRRSGFRAPTSISAWWPGPSSASSPRRTPARRPPRPMQRWFERTPDGWRAKQPLRSDDDASQIGDLLKLRPARVEL